MHQHELISCLNRAAPNDLQRQRMLDAILNAEKGEPASVRRAARRLLPLAAVIALCVLTATAALAVSFGWDAALLDYLKPSGAQIEALSGAVDTPEATITENGVTITVRQTLADSSGIYVLYDMTVPEGVELDESTAWSFWYLSVPYEETDEYITAGSAGAQVLAEGGSTRTVLLHTQLTAPLMDGTITLEFRDLGSFKTQPENLPAGTGSPKTEFVTLVEGEWRLSWPFHFVDSGRTIEVNEPLSIGKSSGTLTRVVISPMSVCVYVTGDAIVGSAKPTVHFKDGSEIVFTSPDRNADFGYYLIDEESMLYANQLYCRFDQIVDLAEVESVTVGDVTVPLE